MKTLVAILLTMSLLVSNASAQYSSAKRQARGLESKINDRHNAAEDGAPPPGLPPKPGTAQPASPTPPTAQPANAPIKPTTQQLAASKLKSDIAAAHTNGVATAEMKHQFVIDLASAAQGRSQPSAVALAKFGEALLTSLAAKNIALTEDTKLIKAIVVSLNSAGLYPARLQELNDEVQAVLIKAGVPTGEASVASQNLAVVVSDIQSSATK